MTWTWAWKNRSTDPQLSRQEESALQPGEQLLWKGRPLEGVRVHFSLEMIVFLIIGTAMLGVGVIFSPVMLVSKIPVIFFWALDLPFLLVGVIFLAFTVGHPFFEARRLAKTRYAVTDQRLLVWSPKRISSYQIRGLAGLNVKLYKDGSGTIYLKHNRIHGYVIQFLFEEIPNAETVYHLIERQMINAG